MTGLETRPAQDIKVKDFSNALFLLGIRAPYEVFTMKRLNYLQRKHEVNILLYEPRSYVKTTLATRNPLKQPHPKTLHLLLKEGETDTTQTVLENFTVLLTENKKPVLFHCHVMPKCGYTTHDKRNFNKHTLKCARISQKKITCKQVSYGDDRSTLKQMVDEKILPSDVLTYRNYAMATYDIETIERRFTQCAPDRGTVTEADLLLLSIACGSNLPNYEPKCWIRKSSDPADEKPLIKKFLIELQKIYDLKQATLPAYFEAAEVQLDATYDAIKATTKGKTRDFELRKISQFKREIRKFRRLNIYGFNSSRFDLPTIAPTLFTQLIEKDKEVPSVLKKTTSYFNVTTEKFSFQDCMKFTAPCSLDKFLKVWDAPCGKSIWPYTFYSSIEEINSAKTFPSLAAFKSELNGKSVSMADYIKEKREFYRLKLLLPADPNRIRSMRGWLRRYNLIDVQPLALAIENCFKSYSEYFSVNPMISQSLPALAQEAMYKNFSKTSPLFYSFPEKFKEVNQLFRRNVIGGLCNVFSRHSSTDLDPNLPFRATHTPDGSPITNICMLDFNSMYLKSQSEDMPCSPGIVWNKRPGSKWHKAIMNSSGHSLHAQQWLTYKQVSDPFLLNKDGTRAIIDTAFHRGEKELPNSAPNGRPWRVDGYAKSDNGVKIYEFFGDRFHNGCPRCDPHGVDSTFERKRRDLEQIGVIETIWECEFYELLPKIKNVETPLIPHILSYEHSLSDILDSIRESKLFGFIVCDLHTPPDLISSMANFPPVIKRFEVTDAHLTEFMASRVKKRYPNQTKFLRKTVVQCFNAENHLLLTSLAKFYLDSGLQITNITKVIQYIPSKALKPFTEKVTRMRIEAELEGKFTKGNTSKTFGNAGYGKTTEQVAKYTDTKLVGGANLEKKLKKMIASPFYKSHTVLVTEDESNGIHEFVMDKRKVTDDKLVHVGVCILQQSKLMFLQFIQFLRQYLEPGSFQTLYCG